jgi:threonine synthase
MTMNGYRCFSCGAPRALPFDGLTCPGCGGNLDILYDYAQAAGQLEEVLQGRRDDLFRYAPLLPLAARPRDFHLRVGGTPLYAARRLGERAGVPRLWIKDESGNPSASLKDRAGIVALCRAMEEGARTVAVASTGNAGSSLACLAAAADVPAVVFVPAAAPRPKLVQLMSYGCRVLAVRGGYDDAFDLCLRASTEFGWFNRSTGVNPFTREGKKTWVFETWEALGRRAPDRLMVPSGDGNILSATWKGWCDLYACGMVDRLPRIDCVQASGSDAICRTVNQLRASGDTPDWSGLSVAEVRASTIADSISVNRPRDGLAAVRAVLESGGAAVTVADTEILAAVMEIARHTGIFAEPAAAAPWAALKRLRADGLLDSDEEVVLLVTGSGLKDTARAATAVGAPTEIEPDLGAVRKALEI